MPWTTPKTWLAGAPLLSAELNTHLRDNLAALKAPPTDLYNTNEAANYSTSSAIMVDVDTTNLALTIETTGGDILVGFTGSVVISGSASFDIALDGVRVAGDHGILQVGNLRSDEARPISFAYLIQSVPAATHVLKLQWMTDNSIILFAGAALNPQSYGTLCDVHTQFWAREIS